MPKNKRSKKKKREKRVWRGIDSSGVESISVKKTEAELAGGALKPDAQLFFVDKQRSNDLVPPVERKARARAKILYVQKRIDPYPHVKGTIKGQTKKRKRVAGVDKRKIKKRKLSEKQHTKQNSDSGNSEYFDIWETPKDSRDKIIEKFPEIEKEYLEPEKPIKPPKRITPSLMPAVELPKEGTSYNPAFESHQALLKEAVEEQLKKRKEIKDTLAKLKAEQKRHWNPEADPILLPGPLEEEEETEDDETTERVFQPYIHRKLQSEINKQIRKKKLEVELRDRKKEKENNKRLGLMDEFVEEIKESEKKSEDKQTEREEMKEKKNT